MIAMVLAVRASGSAVQYISMTHEKFESGCSCGHPTCDGDGSISRDWMVAATYDIRSMDRARASHDKTVEHYRRACGDPPSSPE